jgi:hypothetical protein
LCLINQVEQGFGCLGEAFIGFDAVNQSTKFEDAWSINELPIPSLTVIFNDCRIAELIVSAMARGGFRTAVRSK